jgi:prepilin-type processing-associated H-X9-DG protein
MRITRAKHRHFNFLELIVVLAVGAVLLSTGMSALRGLNDKAQSALCTSNLRLMGQAAQAYAAASDGWLPFPGVSWYAKSKLGGKMDAWIDASVASKNTDKFLCPADLVPLEKRADSASKLWSLLENGKGGWVKLSYGINLFATGAPKHAYFRAHRLNDLAVPESCFLLGDAAQRDVTSPSGLLFRHGDAANAVFADGHVALLKPEEVPKFKSNLEQGFWVGGNE